MWFYLSVGVLALGCMAAFLLWRGTTHGHTRFASSRILTPFRVVAAGIAIAIYLLTLPTVTSAYTSPLSWSNTIFGALYVTFQIFVANADISGPLDAFRTASDIGTQVQAAYTIILFAIAPLMAIGFLLTFLQTFSAYARYLIHPLREVNVFSELNERSIALATSIRAENRRNKRSDSIVFTDVVLANNEPSRELIEQAHSLGALCFKNDALSLPLRWHRPGALLRFFLMSSDDEKNLQHAVGIISHDYYGSRDNTDLYVFSASVESELALRYRPGKVRVRRVDYTRELVYDWLWRTPSTASDIAAGAGRPAGLDLFANAIPLPNNDKAISAVILGLGGYGLEMLKALAWYCQMDTASGTYRLTVNAYDKDSCAATRFATDYPELADGTHNGPSPTREHPRQDALYDITVHGGVDALSPDIFDQLSSLTEITFVFVCLGDDSRNLEAAVRLRKWLVQDNQNHFCQGNTPQIVVVSYHSKQVQTALQASLEATRTHASKDVRIDLIGDIVEVYSYDAVIKSLVEHNGLVSHMQWASLTSDDWHRAESTFWTDSYLYGSSIAVPIHWRARRMLAIPGATSTSRTESEQEFLSRLEHARWNAFLRGEGFVRGDVKDLAVAKTHPLLVPFDDLPDDEKQKDRNDSLDALASIKAKLASELEKSPSDKENYRDTIDFVNDAEGWVAQNVTTH